MNRLSPQGDLGLRLTTVGAHYLSDVLGATAAGLAWLVLRLTAVDTLRRYRAHLAGK